MADQTKQDVEDVVSALNREPAQSAAPAEAVKLASTWRRENIEWEFYEHSDEVDKMLAAYAALRTAQLERQHAEIIKMQAGMFREKTDELKSKLTTAESSLAQARERTRCTKENFEGFRCMRELGHWFTCTYEDD